MKKVILILLAISTVLPVLGCSSPQPLNALIQSNKARVTQPSVAQSDQTALVDGNNAFAFRLYQHLRTGSGNLFYSPFSISEALAMTYAGARGITETSMATALNLTLPQDRLHPAFNYIDLKLKSRGQGAKGATTEGFKLNVVNAVWGQQGFSFLPAFLDVLAQNYGAGLRIVDYIDRTEQSRVTINNWVSDQTAGKIKDLLPQGSVNKLTRLVLTNAVYFNAAWKDRFEKSATADGAFNRLTGGPVTVPMMHESKDMKYIEGSNFQAVQLPYDGDQLAMVILLPKAGQFDGFEKLLDGQTVKGIMSGLQMARVNLTMPKFQFESEFGLKSALSALGMGVAFTQDADFSGMNGNKDLLIQDVVHKAYVGVDENGTEAAAATGVVVGITSMPTNQATVTIDRPFIFLIRDIPTGSIIFVGRVMDPSAK